jgi:predicted acyl esterase
MVPVRDGVHLQTVYLAPLDQKEPLPILLLPMAYGAPENDQNLQKSPRFSRNSPPTTSETVETRV